MKKFALTLLLGVVAGAATAQIAPDTLARRPRPVSQAVLDTARADGAFVYRDEAVAPEGETLWQWLVRKINEALNVALNPNARPIHYGLFALLVVWLVVLIARMEPRSALGRAAARVPLASAMPETLGAHDYLALARAAREKGDARLAARFLFLHVLQRLGDAGRIAYRPEKTNRQYVQEVGGALRPLFVPFVRAFEQAWYGGVAPTEAGLDRLESALAPFENEVAGGQ